MRQVRQVRQVRQTIGSSFSKTLIVSQVRLVRQVRLVSQISHLLPLSAFSWQSTFHREKRKHCHEKCRRSLLAILSSAFSVSTRAPVSEGCTCSRFVLPTELLCRVPGPACGGRSRPGRVGSRDSVANLEIK